ncbi:MULTISPECIES: SDR family oxidoreductase [Pseudomonas syringae group]|uniref:Short-chain dehydrogenase/reductase SDR n=2 Tax=Pseudomonas amygdali TaxID=47877 RepID=A0A0Q0E0G8_PSEAJ|nr:MULTISPECIES: SDR family oxidoreductase [Pseudomonas syringae group]KPX62357.1 Short-chain dehydrogenase/reductase SDR [Pseudomonas amygdali pv. lachrymans]ELQ09023.1 short-chain dehydrogenase/reductase SDR [Pseudomonas syringae BRIP39023]KEZ26380.1 short-chain dehydrogenase [Pseudomonas amygdali pv. tabaci str. 6605]KPB30044.1 Short-chain dehydrogenase/reductase SDR [Pseudomonas syringae pv. syringae]KPY78918.1 Short-chain dehydrogenase/reductase SDR [Pseudomonas amygdali pv. tabaci]
MSNVKNTVIVITGASSGIGAASAIKLASLGGKVVLAARNEEKLKALVAEIRNAGGEASYYVTNVTDKTSLVGLVEFAIKQYGRIDSLVNNAGLMLFSDWKDVVVDDWEKMIDTNIKGYLYAIAAALPQMLEQGHGKILNMSSVAGLHVGGSSGVYSATKFFIRGITESLRKEVGVDSGVQVSMISPGVIDTGWADKVSDAKGREAAKALNEIAITPEQVADAVAYALDQPTNLTINDIVIHPTKQDW